MKAFFILWWPSPLALPLMLLEYCYSKLRSRRLVHPPCSWHSVTTCFSKFAWRACLCWRPGTITDCAFFFFRFSETSVVKWAEKLSITGRDLVGIPSSSAQLLMNGCQICWGTRSSAYDPSVPCLAWWLSLICYIQFSFSWSLAEASVHWPSLLKRQWCVFFPHRLWSHGNPLLPFNPLLFWHQIKVHWCFIMFLMKQKG